MNTLKLEFTESWREVAPRADAPDLLMEEAGRLLHRTSDFTQLYDFGPVGPVDCPVAYNPVTRTAYRYVCAASTGRRDYSQLRAYELNSGRSYAVFDLPLNQWVLWLLEWIGRAGKSDGQLLGLLATDRPADDRVVIEHKLMALRPGETQAKLRPLCRDAYRPLAFNRQRKQFVFSGAEGVYVVGLNGQREATFPGSLAHAHGACFDPKGSGRVIVAGEGLYLWDLETEHIESLHRSGRHPVWAVGQEGFWFRESSSDLYYYDLNKRRATKHLSVQNQRNPEFWHARPAQPSKCGCYLALGLTGKKLKGISRKSNLAGEAERIFVHEHRTCLLDLERSEYWTVPGMASSITWAP